MNTTVVGPTSEWEPTNKTINVRTTTWKRLQRYFTHYGSTYDSVISQILDEKEGKETPSGDHSIVTKQTTAAPEEKPTAELLLRRFKMMDEIVADVRKKNIEAGLDPKYMGYYIMYDSNNTPEKQKYQNWLAKVTNKRTGKFNQVADLKARDLIPEEELSEHEGKIFPYRRLNSLCKIKTGDGKLWLMRFETWFGLDAAGQEQHIGPLNILGIHELCQLSKGLSMSWALVVLQ